MTNDRQQNVIEDLRRSLAWLDLALASLNEGVLVLNPDLRIVFANDAIASLLGTPRIGLLGQPLDEALPLTPANPDLQPGWPPVLPSHEGRETLTGTYILNSPRGLRQIELTVREITNTGQAVIVLHDITQRQLAERQRVRFLEEKAARLAAEEGRKRFQAQYRITKILYEADSIETAIEEILPAIGESLDWDFGAYWILDPARKELRCSQTWRRRSGRLKQFADLSMRLRFGPEEGLPGKVLVRRETVWTNSFLPAHQFPRFAQIPSTGLKAGFAFPVLRGGDPIAVMEFFSPRDEAPGADTLTAMATTGIQIADFMTRKELERQKDDFLAIASHELRTPVTSVKTYGQTLERRLTKDGHKGHAELARRLNAQVDSLGRLITDLLDTSRIEAGKLELRTEAFDLSALIAETVRDTLAESRGHAVRIETPEPVPVQADAERIRQVLTNLISNAIKFSPEGEEITVSALRRDAEVTVAVADRGVGIPPGQEDNVFERFYQAREQGRTLNSGLGLGLFISAAIVHAHGGNIRAKNRDGGGSVFSFTLPAGAGLKNP